MGSRPPTFSACPNRANLSAYLRGSLSPAELAGLDSHLSECPVCVLRLGDLATPPATGRTPADRPPGWTPIDPPPPESGSNPRRLGQYRLREQIGRGGMGTVYRAWHERLKKWVAVKVLPAGRSSDPDWVARFDREMEIVGRLDHPHIVRATDAGEAGGVHYLVMELLDGADLGRVSKACGPLPVAEACELVRQAALGLQHAHTHGLVHRDVKPHNLMLSAGGVKVLDLGLAMFRPDGLTGGGITTVGQVMGTPDYMAPEQWDDFRRVDARADVYALGCTLYHLLTGKPPFDRRGTPTTPGGLPTARPDVPAELVALVDRMTARAPADRPASANHVACELAPFATGADPTALLARVPPEAAVTADWENSPPAPTVTHTAPRRRRPVWAAAVAAVAVVAVTAGMVARGGGGGPPPLPDPEPTPIPEQRAILAPIPEAARPPAKGEWVGLLKTPPTPRLWKGDFGTRHDHDPAGEALSIQTIGRALIPLGTTDARAYQMQVAIRQTVWTGGIGVYFGGRTEPDGRFTFQMIELRKFQPENGRPFQVARATGEVQPGGVQAHSSTHLFASTILPRPPGNQEQLVEFMMDRRGLVWVRWDGDQCHELTGNAENSRFRPEDYFGEFGIYSNTGSTLVRAARYLTRP